MKKSDILDWLAYWWFVLSKAWPTWLFILMLIGGGILLSK